MWGQIITEASNQKNFNFGFSSYKSEILIHLSQWQYWWWFWFTFVWSLYFFIIIKNVQYKTLNYNLVINTSLRGHGKWGDFLVALIPLSWCGNILVNSNFILRMIEWQNESSLLTIRVQGKQWYWVYKYSSDTNSKLNSVYRNIGHNNWFRGNFQSTYTDNNYNFINNFIFDYEFYKNYVNILSKNEKLANKLDLTKLIFNSVKWDLSNSKVNSINIKTINLNTTTNSTKEFKFMDLDNFEFSDISNYQNKENLYNLNHSTINDYRYIDLDATIDSTKEFKFMDWEDFEFNNIAYYQNKGKLYKLNDFIINEYTYNFKLSCVYKDIFNLVNDSIHTKYKNISQYNDSILEEVEESTENLRAAETTAPANLNLDFLNKNLGKNETSILKFTASKSGVIDKDPQSENFWGFRQKKTKKLKVFNFNNAVQAGANNYTDKKSLDNKFYEKYNFYIANRNNRNKSELIPVTLARRLLRTKRTLVLPAHINLTVITSSYDVIHSWFIPGLGIKLDCVPGRSTHHTFYIDNIGFYYGQCAEICGRYHHHMPIRICALSFEHFLIWWQSKGLPRLSRLDTLKTNKSKLLSKFDK